jgi:hypothetical protein
MTTPDLGKLFETFTTSAFRLECLPAYDVTEDAEREAYAAWSAGEELPPVERDWPKLVASAVAAGKTMQRVRLIETPPTEYQRFEMEHGYPDNVAAGEEIAILDHKPDGLLTVDFWLFDDTTAVVLEYDDAGRFLRPVVAETVEPYRHARDLALASAVLFRQGESVDAFLRRRLAEPGVVENIATLALGHGRGKGNAGKLW